MHPKINPFLIADPALTAVRDELASREPIFHRPELGTTRADFENMTSTDFWEIGASGRRYSRDHVLHELEERYQNQVTDTWEPQTFVAEGWLKMFIC